MTTVIASGLVPLSGPGQVRRCSAPGCGAYATWGLFGCWFCTAHRPAGFLNLAQAHSREVREDAARYAGGGRS